MTLWPAGKGPFLYAMKGRVARENNQLEVLHFNALRLNLRVLLLAISIGRN